MRKTQLPEKLDSFLKNEWLKISSSERKDLAEEILALSRHFQEPSGLQTPWHREATKKAYLFYFFPLNIARGRALFESLKPVLSQAFTHLFDLGAGLGNLTLLQQEFPDWLHGPITSVDRFPPSSPWLPHSQSEIPSVIPPHSTAFFSFSWVEMKTSIEALEKFENLIFIEPSTSHVARQLMSLRQNLLDRGFFPLGPCTHQKSCPLLVHSSKDWCHDRVHFQAPSWFLELENLLPMKNKSLTYSYLVMSKRQPMKTQGLTRVIGDTLKEKGKTRQAICYDNERRFLSWLKRDHKNVKQIDHGALISIKEALEKGNELRVLPTTHIEEFWPVHNTEIP